MKNSTNWQPFFLIPLGMIAVALFLYRFDPLQLHLQKHAPASRSGIEIQRKGNIDPYYVKGFKQLDGQYFIVILDGTAPENCPCGDIKVRRGKDPNCPVVHHREKKEIIARGRKLGLPEYNFPVLEVCD